MVLTSPEPTPQDSPAPRLTLIRKLVAFTPLAGTLAVPVVVPLLMVRVGIGAGVAAAVLLSSLWFVAMLRTAEMPQHD
ncbi:hypothetical protein [Vulcanococcus limneticus]|uniref:hypothetical protein n=1 Tax=Vulcanococcus limneticus TaxID=2170428 RepID=UPI00398C1746